MQPETASSTALPLDRAVGLLKVAGEPARLRLLALLGEGDLTVSDLTRILAQSQPRISRHLKLLAEAGLVERTQDGSWVHYRLARNEAVETVRALTRRLDPADAELSRDAERLAVLRAEHGEAADAFFASVAADWDRIRALHAPEATVEHAMLDLVTGDLSDNGKVKDGKVAAMLDLGTGTGRMLELFAPFYDRALGLDFSREMLAVARAKLAEAGLTRASVRRTDITAPDVARGAWDLVTMHQVLHFLDRPETAVREACRALAPGGRMLIADFAPHGHEFLREQAHRRLGFASGEVGGWIEDAGAGVVEVREVPPAAADGLTVLLWLARR